MRPMMPGRQAAPPAARRTGPDLYSDLVRRAAAPARPPHSGRGPATGTSGESVTLARRHGAMSSGHHGPGPLAGRDVLRAPRSRAARRTERSQAAE
ncbi:hypothetical protein [Nonomuraea sediminis]|uniref:hypothetical protein n=1 Tax=Nonomuraea sediminis TaxID=2835864 RepID=UPI001BDBE21E|nr:hypothetical protein [Nonomuraea sediminis]